MGCWSDDLPPELLSLISTLLTKNSDYILFRSVCVSWRRAAASQPRHLPLQPPLLIRFNTINSAYRGFYSISTNITHWIHLPETLHKRCCGSSHGWLAFVDRSLEVFLFNPLTRARIDLPAITTLDCVQDDYRASNRWNEYGVLRIGYKKFRSSIWTRDYCIEKIVLSSSPHAGVPWTAMALLGLTGDIMFWRPGDANWTVIVRRRRTLDIVCYNGLFYSIDNAGKLVAVDVDADPSADAKTTVVVHRSFDTLGDRKYLVESDGEILLAVRYVHAFYGLRHTHRTHSFDIYKLDLKGEPKCSMVKSLGGRALFLGTNHSFSFPSADFPGCRGNCIYFTDDLQGYVYRSFGGYGSGLFNIEEDSVQPFPCYHPIDSRFVWPLPVWITPNLC
uniref:F-box protein SKIP23-like n=1 Tax=Elaeis guineensis var. tenera TaxID=51953 RepID=A0A6I9QKK9_ELAGV|nr:F-box protein SKIP23-like [Elaeis guineensis]